MMNLFKIGPPLKTNKKELEFSHFNANSQLSFVFCDLSFNKAVLNERDKMLKNRGRRPNA